MVLDPGQISAGKIHRKWVIVPITEAGTEIRSKGYLVLTGAKAESEEAVRDFLKEIAP